MTDIVLRPIVATDLEMLREHRNRPDTRVWLGDAREISAQQQAEWFRLRPLDEDSQRAQQIAMCGDVPVGLVRVMPGPSVYVDGHSLRHVWTVGCDVFAAHRGNGFGKTVFKAACDYAIEHGAAELRLQVFAENIPAVYVYTLAGFRIDPNVEVKAYHRGDLLRLAGHEVDLPTHGFLHLVTMTKRVA